MQKIIRPLAVVMAIVLALAFAMPAFADESLVSAQTYVVMDADTGDVLLEKGADDQMYPASTTKMMTMAIAYEKLKDRMDDVIVVSDAAADIPADSSAAWFVPGEEITVRDAFMATYLISANDGANVLLETAYGNIDAGIEAMNKKLQDLGCTYSHFANAHGYYDANHHISARDMALVVRYALGLDGFQDILKVTNYAEAPTNEAPYGRYFETQNEMVMNGPMYYAGVVGGKSGWTRMSGYTEVEIADVKGHTLICVVMNSGGSALKFYDCINLFESAKLKL